MKVRDSISVRTLAITPGGEGAVQSESYAQPRREKWLAHPKVSNKGGGRETPLLVPNALPTDP